MNFAFYRVLSIRSWPSAGFLFTFLLSAAAHLRNFGEHFTQDTDRPFAP